MRFLGGVFLCFLTFLLFFQSIAFSGVSLITVGASSPLVADLIKNVGGRRIKVELFPKWREIKVAFWLGKELEPEVYRYIISRDRRFPEEHLLGYIPRIDDNPYEIFDALAVENFIYRVSRMLKKLDPEGESYYQRNLARYTVAIEGTFKDGRWTMARHKGKMVYTLSPHFSYLLKEIGLKEVRVSLDKIESLKGVLIDNPDNPCDVSLPKGLTLVKLLIRLTPKVSSYLDLLKENFLSLGFALSQRRDNK
ncbi:MAG: hypothetical protein J7M13_07565 [Synergistetes bacterium]|nr:hypothetical protein [Synergistota bacterium]